MVKNAKLVNNECVPIKSYDGCIISKPADMQVYKVEKRPGITRFQAFETLFVFDVKVVQKMCYMQ